MAPFWEVKSTKILQKWIPKGIKVLIDFWVDIWSTWGPISAAKTSPRRAQEAAKTAKTAPRGRQDGPRGRQDGPKRVPKNRGPPSFFGVGRQEPPRTPRDPSKIDFWSFSFDLLVDFRFLFGRFLVDFCLIFDSLFDRFLERILLLFSLFFSLSLSTQTSTSILLYSGGDYPMQVSP